jgi:putative oxidoreductase
MKILKIIANYMLALMFLVFGLNFFFNFVPMPPLEGNAATFIGLLASTGFMATLKVLEIILSLMLIVEFRRPLVYILLAPISINILMFEIFIAGSPAAGVLVVILNLFLLITNIESYKGIWKKS